MSKHWYRNNRLNSNKLLDDLDLIPEGYTREAYSKFQSIIQSGENHPNFGKHRSDETKKKISLSNIGKKRTEETKKNISNVKKGIKRFNYHPDHRGENNPRFGKKSTLSEESYKSFQEKRNNTLRKNNSFNTSKPEEDYYNYLLTIYDKDDIIRQYKSTKYPFNCDFYIKSEDKYIECNYSWLHGGHPFNGKNLEDIRKLNTWIKKSSTSKFYENAIITWTIRDQNKIAIANKNKLNIEFLYQY